MKQHGVLKCFKFAAVSLWLIVNKTFIDGLQHVDVFRTHYSINIWFTTNKACIIRAVTPAVNLIYSWHRCDDTDQSARRGGASDAHVGVHLPQSVTDGGEVAAQVLHHVLDAAGVFEQVDALRVRVVVHRERTLDRLGKLPVAETRHTQEVRLS